MNRRRRINSEDESEQSTAVEIIDTPPGAAVANLAVPNTPSSFTFFKPTANSTIDDSTRYGLLPPAIVSRTKAVEYKESGIDNRIQIGFRVYNFGPRIVSDAEEYITDQDLEDVRTPGEMICDRVVDAILNRVANPNAEVVNTIAWPSINHQFPSSRNILVRINTDTGAGKTSLMPICERHHWFLAAINDVTIGVYNSIKHYPGVHEAIVRIEDRLSDASRIRTNRIDREINHLESGQQRPGSNDCAIFTLLHALYIDELRHGIVTPPQIERYVTASGRQDLHDVLRGFIEDESLELRTINALRNEDKTSLEPGHQVSERCMRLYAEVIKSSWAVRLTEGVDFDLKWPDDVTKFPHAPRIRATWTFFLVRRRHWRVLAVYRYDQPNDEDKSYSVIVYDPSAKRQNTRRIDGAAALLFGEIMTAIGRNSENLKDGDPEFVRLKVREVADDMDHNALLLLYLKRFFLYDRNWHLNNEQIEDVLKPSDIPMLRREMKFHLIPKGDDTIVARKLTAETEEEEEKPQAPEVEPEEPRKEISETKTIDAFKCACKPQPGRNKAKDHVVTKHGGIYYICHLCDLVKKITHRGPTGSYTEKYNFREHIKKHHADFKDLDRVCEKVTATREAVYRHMCEWQATPSAARGKKYSPPPELLLEEKWLRVLKE